MTRDIAIQAMQLANDDLANGVIRPDQTAAAVASYAEWLTRRRDRNIVSHRAGDFDGE